MLDAQCRPALLNGEQAVDVGMLARICAGIVGVFGEYFQALPGRLVIDRTVSLREVVVDRQRALAARLVFDGGDDIFFLVEQVDRSKV